MKRRSWRRRVGLLFGLVLAGLLAREAITWPAVARLGRERPRSTAFIDHYRATHPGQPPAWTFVPYERISDDLKRAVIVSEDASFFSHDGFDWDEIENAVDDTVAKGKPLRGASTISQQLAKNLWLTPSRNPWRKVREALLTLQLERELSKRRILELYLNVVELGPGIYGAEAAARHWFGKPAAELTAEEAAALAAALPRPTSWHPGVAAVAYQKRIARILRRMEKATWLRTMV